MWVCLNLLRCALPWLFLPQVCFGTCWRQWASWVKRSQMSGSVHTQVSRHAARFLTFNFHFKVSLRASCFSQQAVPWKWTASVMWCECLWTRPLKWIASLRWRPSVSIDALINKDGAPTHPKKTKRILEHVLLWPLDGTQYHLLSPSLAAQCGYSMESDPWGNTRIYTSLLACYVDSTVLHLRAL